MMDFDDMKDKFDKEFEEIKKSIERPNILLTGATGVGKSSLVNLCFGDDFATTGTGKPVTQNIRSFSSDKVPIVLFDTPGYEVGSEKQKKYFNDIIDYASKDTNRPINRQIHLIWYLVQASGHRLTDLDKNIINSFININKPTAVVFTKCDLVTQTELDTLHDELRSDSEAPFFDVTIKKLPLLGHIDLLNLINWSADSLPDSLKDAFVRSQKLNLSLKKKQATKITLQHTTGSAFTGMVPIPFSDAPLLIANQMAMFERIIYLYDLEGLTERLTSLIKGFGFEVLVANTGRWLVAQLIKLIPGLGTAFGAIISGTVAATITYAIGEALSELCFQISQKIVDGDTEKLEKYLKNSEFLFKTYFEEFLKKATSDLNKGTT